MDTVYANVLSSKTVGSVPFENYVKRDSNDHPFLDFQEIKPVPDALNPDKEGCLDGNMLYVDMCLRHFLRHMADEKNVLERRLFTRSPIEDLQFRYHTHMNQSAVNKMIEDGRVYMYNYTTTGHLCWTEWRNANWGCLSNGLNYVAESDKDISFYTKGGFPGCLVRDLSTLYPDTRLSLTSITFITEDDAHKSYGYVTEYEGGKLFYAQQLGFGEPEKDLTDQTYQMLKRQFEKCQEEM